MTAFYIFPDEPAFLGIKDLAQCPVDVIGKVAVLDEDNEPVMEIVEGEEEPQQVYKPGFHVNAASAVQEWEEFEVHPETPMRVFG